MLEIPFSELPSEWKQTVLDIMLQILTIELILLLECLYLVEFDCISGLSFYFDHDPENSTKIISFTERCILRYYETFK